MRINKFCKLASFLVRTFMTDRCGEASDLTNGVVGASTIECSLLSKGKKCGKHLNRLGL